MFSKLAFFAAGLTAIAFSHSTTAVGQVSHTDSIKKFIASDVIAIGYADLTRIDLEKTIGLMKSAGLEKSIQYRNMATQLPEIETELERIEQECFRQAYVLMRTSDVQEQSTVFVFPLVKDADAANATATVKSLLARFFGQSAEFYSIENIDGCLVAATESRIANLNAELKTQPSESVEDRAEMWKAIGNSSMGIALFGDDDSRRVAKELMPTLPAPFSVLNGELVADGIAWTGMTMDFSDTPSISFHVEATEEKYAVTVEKLLKGALSLAKFAPQIRQMLPKEEVKLVFDAIAPKREGTRVSMSAGKLKDELPRIAKLISPQLQTLRTRARTQQLKNNLRQYALGMLNYESARGHFPAQASIDEDGQPLLSWRVQILPFLNEQALYDQFKLDEPWDSPHNIKLVEKMPQIYWNPNSDNFETNEKGKTIFQVPAGKDLVFDKDKTSKFKDLTDGSSNTILIAAMPDQQAVIWTKPVDWQVDLENPLQPFEASKETSMKYALCDGSVQEVSLESLKSEIRKLITPADGEIVDPAALSN